MGATSSELEPEDTWEDIGALHPSLQVWGWVWVTLPGTCTSLLGAANQEWGTLEPPRYSPSTSSHSEGTEQGFRQCPQVNEDVAWRCHHSFTDAHSDYRSQPNHTLGTGPVGALEGLSDLGAM